MKKSIVLLPEDLFFSFLDTLGLNYNQVEKKIFSDIPGVSFLCIKIPNNFYNNLNTNSPCKNWTKDALIYENNSVFDFTKKKQIKENNFLFLMFASKNGTSICSLHGSDIPKLRGDTRPPFIAMVNGGKKTKTNFTKPFLEYREYPFPNTEVVVNYFYSEYKSLVYSQNYQYDAVDNEIEEIFSDMEKPKQEKNIILKTLPH